MELDHPTELQLTSEPSHPFPNENLNVCCEFLGTEISSEFQGVPGLFSEFFGQKGAGGKRN